MDSLDCVESSGALGLFIISICCLFVKSLPIDSFPRPHGFVSFAKLFSFLS